MGDTGDTPNVPAVSPPRCHACHLVAISPLRGNAVLRRRRCQREVTLVSPREVTLVSPRGLAVALGPSPAANARLSVRGPIHRHRAFADQFFEDPQPFEPIGAPHHGAPRPA